MALELEIEYKQMLNVVQYKAILNDIINNGRYQEQVHVNYYFDTADYDLYHNQQMLRIRVLSDSEYEICLKTRQKDGVLEDNHIIDQIRFNELYDNPQLLNKYYGLSYDLKFITILKTHRITQEREDGLICLDHSTYHNTEDYEIEFEAKEYNEIDTLLQLLFKNNIEYQNKHITKIERCLNSLGGIQ